MPLLAAKKKKKKTNKGCSTITWISLKRHNRQFDDKYSKIITILLYGNKNALHNMNAVYTFNELKIKLLLSPTHHHMYSNRRQTHLSHWFPKRHAAHGTCCLLIQPVWSAASPPGCYRRGDSWHACVHSALFTSSALQRGTGWPQGLRLVPPGNWLHQ